MDKNTVLYRWCFENKLDLYHDFSNTFYHFSLKKFSSIKDINGRKEISLFLSKPEKKV